jgi:hypothetical protein
MLDKEFTILRDQQIEKGKEKHWVVVGHNITF